MSKCRPWISVWLCSILTFLVLFSGIKGIAVPPLTPVFAASSQEAEMETAPALSPMAVERYIADKGVELPALVEEERQAEQMKQEVRESELRQRSHAQYLLASRSVHLAKYAQYEKAQLGQKVASQALAFLGTPYVWGGTNPGGFDCSGFTQYVYSRFGVTVPRNSYDQYDIGKTVRQNELQPGDLVFFTTYAPGPSHLGIYVGEGQFVHALNSQTGVITSTLDNEYYRDRFLGGKRVI